MPRLILAVGGANLGSFPTFFTDEEREHLQLFRRIFDVDITNANTQITASAVKNRTLRAGEAKGCPANMSLKRWTPAMCRERGGGVVQLDLDGYDSTASTLNLSDVAYCPTAYCNLVSLSLLLNQTKFLSFHKVR